MLRVHILPYFAGKDAASITRADVEAFMMDLVSRRSRGTMLNVVNLLHAILDEALRDGVVPTNAVSQARKPRAPRANKKPRFLSAPEVESVIRAVSDDALGDVERTLYFVAAWTGLRQGELLALRWRNVDFNASVIRVEESWSANRLTDPKSFRSIRTVPMIREVEDALASLATRDLWTGANDLVFPNPYTGRHLSAQRVIDRFRLALDTAGLGNRAGRDGGITFHSLRHVFGTQMAMGGVPVRSIQAWLGHANIQTTEIYAAYAPDASNGRHLAQEAFARRTRGDDAA